MAQYDGSIRINTEIQTKQAKVQLATLENRIVKTADKISSLRSKMDALKNAKIPTDEYKALDKELSKLGAEYDKIAERQRRFLETGGKEGSSAYKRMEYDLDALDRKQDEVIAKMKQLEASGKAFTLGTDTQEYANYAQQLKDAENEMEILNQKHEVQSLKVEKAENEYKKLGSVAGNALKRIGSTIKSSAISAMQKLISVAKKAGSYVKSIASKLLGMGKSAKSASGEISGMGAGFKNLLKYGLGIRSLYALVNKFRTAVKEGFGNLAQYSQPVNAALSSLKSALTQLKNSLATAFAPILTAIAPALTTLINLASRAATAVGMLIAALTGAKTFTKATAVQEDYADALGGTAKAAKNANKQLSSLDKLNNLTPQDDAGGGGGGGGINPEDMFETVDISDKISDLAEMIKKAWENADFTEIGSLIGSKLKDALENIPWDEIETEAERIGKSLATLLNGFVEVPGLGETIGRTIARAINTGIKSLKTFAENVHWDKVGKFIADMINGALTNIDWETALSAAKLFGAGIATALNNALTPETFSNIGYTLGMLINTAIEFAKSFLETFDWKSFGSGIAIGLNTAISTIDWGALGDTIGLALNALFETIGSFAETFDWAGFGESVGKSLTRAISKFDWGKAGASLGKTVNGLFKALKGFMDKTDWKKLGKGITTAIGNFLGNINWKTVGGTISSFAKSTLDFLIGLFKGIEWGEIPQKIIDDISDFFSRFDYKGVFGSVGELVGTAIAAGIDLLKALGEVLEGAWDSVVDYFKGYIEDSGGNIVQGLLNGIIDALKNIGTWIVNNIFKPFIDGFKKAFGIHSPSKVMKEQGGFIIDGIRKGITEKWSDFIGFWKDKKDAMIKKFDNIKDKFITKGAAVVSGIKNGISTNWPAFSSWLGDKKKKVVDKFSDIKSKMESVGKNIVNGIKDGIQAVWSSLTKIADKIKGLFEITPKISTATTSVAKGGAAAILPRAAAAAVETASIPKLATGAVIPANKEFLAVLGDQKNGTNIEAPLDTIKQANKEAFMELLSKLGVSGGLGAGKEINLNLTVECDGYKLLQLIQKLDLEHYMSTGKPLFQH